MSESSLSLSRVTGIIVFLVKTIKIKLCTYIPLQVEAKLDSINYYIMFWTVAILQHGQLRSNCYFCSGKPALGQSLIKRLYIVTAFVVKTSKPTIQ